MNLEAKPCTGREHKMMFTPGRFRATSRVARATVFVFDGHSLSHPKSLPKPFINPKLPPKSETPWRGLHHPVLPELRPAGGDFCSFGFRARDGFV